MTPQQTEPIETPGPVEDGNSHPLAKSTPAPSTGYIGNSPPQSTRTRGNPNLPPHSGRTSDDRLQLVTHPQPPTLRMIYVGEWTIL